LNRNQLSSLPESMGSIQVGRGLDLTENPLGSVPESSKVAAGSMKKVPAPGSLRYE